MLRDISLSVPAKYPSINEIYCVYVCFHGAPGYKRDDKTSLNLLSFLLISVLSERAIRSRDYFFGINILTIVSSS